jgi:hypothetical protein
MLLQMGAAAANQSWWQTFPWGLVSVVLALIALATTVAIYQMNRKRKTLDYTIVDDVTVLSDRVGALRSEIVINVRNKTLTDPRILRVRFINTGNQEIVKDDFLAGSITTVDGHGIVDSQLVAASDGLETTESGLAPHKSYYADCLNQGEWLEVQYIVEMDGMPKDQPFSAVCRIRGATRTSKLIELISRDDVIVAMVSQMSNGGIASRSVAMLVRLLLDRRGRGRD